jgi:hypothetical protein
VAIVEESPRIAGEAPRVTLSDGSRFINPVDLRKNKFALMTKLQENPGNLLEMFIAMDEVQLDFHSKDEEVRLAAAQCLKQVRGKLESIFNREDRDNDKLIGWEELACNALFPMIKKNKTE